MDATTLKPLNDCVLIEPEPDPTYKEMTGTLLHIPDAYKYGPVDAPKWGRIMSFGPSCLSPDHGSLELKVGDRVLYGKYGWAKVPLGEGKHLALVRECDLIAVDK